MAQNALIRLRRDTAANWTAANPILSLGEPGVETDTDKLKIGDGSTAWNSLGYLTAAASIADGDKGDITVSASGLTWEIDDSAVTLAKMADMATASVIYRKTAGSGAPEVQSLATLKTDLGLTGTNSGDQTSIVGITGSLAEFNAALTGTDFATGGGTATGTNTGDQTITLTGPVTGSGTGSFATSITDGAVSLAKMADVATATVFYRKTAGTGVPEVQTLATLKTDLGLTGTNSGDQTSIVGITGTLAQFNTAITDADITPTGPITTSGLTMATSRLLGRTTASTGAVEELTAAAAKTFLAIASGDVSGLGYFATGTDAANLTGTVNVARFPALSGGDVTSSAGSGTLTIGNGAVSLAKMANVATATVFYRKTAGTGAPEVQTLATLKTDLGLTGTNSGDQTSIVGITGTLAQFNTAITDANIPQASTDLTDSASLYKSGGTDVALADGGTGASLADPNADRLLFWDDSAGQVTWLELGTNLSITGTVLNASGGGGGLSDGDKGDVVVSSSGTVLTVESASPSGGVFNITGDTVISAPTEAMLTITESGSGDNIKIYQQADFSYLQCNGSTGFYFYSGGTQMARFLASGLIAFDFDVTVPDEAYDATAWNGSLEAPTKNAIRDKIESMGGGGAPGGSDRQIQFNDAGAFAGSTALDVDTNGNLRADYAATVTTPGADQITFAPQRLNASGGRVVPRWRSEDGVTMSMATHPGRNTVTWGQAVGGGLTTAIAPIGSPALTAVGTATGRAYASTSRLTRARRLAYVSAATAGQAAGLYNNAAGNLAWTIGGVAGGGFKFIWRGAVTDASLVSGAHAIIGMRTATSAPAVATNPNTLVNLIAFAQLNGGANWHVVYGGSAAQTAVDTGVAINNTSLMEFIIYARPDVNNKVTWRLEDITSGTVASGELTGTAGTALPANTTFLAPIMWRSNNATAAAVGIDICSYYIESDFA